MRYQYVSCMVHLQASVWPAYPTYEQRTSSVPLVYSACVLEYKLYVGIRTQFLNMLDACQRMQAYGTVLEMYTTYV